MNRKRVHKYVIFDGGTCKDIENIFLKALDNLIGGSTKSPETYGDLHMNLLTAISLTSERVQYKPLNIDSPRPIHVL